MPVKWFEVFPANRETASTLEYILRSCQNFKYNSFLRIARGDRKPGGPRGTAEETREQWLREYLVKDPVAEGAPRTAMRHALLEIWGEGSEKRPDQLKNWWRFTVAARAGWQQAIYRTKHISWEEYQRGGRTKVSEPRVVPSRVLDELMRDHTISFRWGKVALTEHEVNKIVRMVEKLEIEFVRWVVCIETVTFRKKEEDGSWSISFALSEERLKAVREGAIWEEKDEAKIA